MRNPFRYFNSSPEVIRLVVMMYVRYPLSLRQVEDILFERGTDCNNARAKTLVVRRRCHIKSDWAGFADNRQC